MISIYLLPDLQRKIKTKNIDILRGLMAGGKWQEAIKYAAKFPRLGAEKDAILKARDCINNPRFYVQLGQNIEANIEAGRQALIAKYEGR